MTGCPTSCHQMPSMAFNALLQVEPGNGHKRPRTENLSFKEINSGEASEATTRPCCRISQLCIYLGTLNATESKMPNGKERKNRLMNEYQQVVNKPEQSVSKAEAGNLRSMNWKGFLRARQKWHPVEAEYCACHPCSLIFLCLPPSLCLAVLSLLIVSDHIWPQPVMNLKYFRMRKHNSTRSGSFCSIPLGCFHGAMGLVAALPACALKPSFHLLSSFLRAQEI